MRRTYKQWSEQFIQEPEKITGQIATVCEALNGLPKSGYVRLSDFSARICGDPRALDFHTGLGALFLRALARRYDTAIPSHLEGSIHLYWQAGLISNGVLSQVTVLGISADSAEINDAACAQYNALGESFVLTLENISRFTGVGAYGEKVFVVENASVFALLCERLRDVKCTLVCASGGLNAALDALLTLCFKSGLDIYYSGNLDVKGLGLGDAMYIKFGKKFNPWRYGKADYELALAENDVLLADEKKDLAMHNEAFASLLSLIRKKGRTASQLPLVGLLAEDIKAMEVR
jgi:uncharacterized protein (TIGR02679 family)